MDRVSAPPPRRLETLVVAVSLEPKHVARLRERFSDVRVETVDRPLRGEDVAEADAVVASNFDAALLAAAPRLGWLHNGGAGVEGLPLRELAASGVLVTNASGVHAINIGEHVLALMLAFARQLPRLIRAQSERRWRDDAVQSGVFELHGQTVLLLGLGDIALAVAERAKALGMRVVGYRRRADLPVPSPVDAVVPIERLDSALAEADHVVVSLPLTHQTRGFVDAARLATMRPGAYLYNVGRGAVVDTAALTQALASGHLGGAGLDVTDPEPLPPDSPLWAMDNVVITAHTSGATPRYWDRGLEIIIENVDRYREGRPLVNEVDPKAGY